MQICKYFNKNKRNNKLTYNIKKPRIQKVNILIHKYTNILIRTKEIQNPRTMLKNQENPTKKIWFLVFT